jgi:uncharacterized protein YjbJ (UPF0337 family)
MEWESIEHNWTDLHKSIKHRWPRIVDPSIEACAGDRNMLVSKIIDCYGLTREQATVQVDEWAEGAELPPKAKHAPAGASKHTGANA